MLALQPSPERLAKGPFEVVPVPIADTGGMVGSPLRAMDTLACMEREGSIGPRERKAGDIFHDLFRSAHFDSLFASDPGRLPVVLANGNSRRGAEGSNAARLAVFGALDALGGMGSPGGSCAWYVLGLEVSLTRWALTVGWGDRRINRKFASGILLTDLWILRGFFST